MGKSKKAAGPTVDELVTRSLVTLATADGPMRLTGKGEWPQLFVSASGTNKEAIARLQDNAAPLVDVVGTGKTATVRLTAVGFQQALPHLPEEKVAAGAKAVATHQPILERISFLHDVVRRTPLSAAELLPILEEAQAAEKVETEARLAAAAKRREQEEITSRALTRWQELLEERRQARIAALYRELEIEGEKVASHVPIVKLVPPIAPRAPLPLPEPESAEDCDFRRQVARRLVASWLETHDPDQPDPRRFIESAIWNIPGFRQVGEAGQQLAFDGRYHEGAAGVFTGDTVRVIRAGWVLDEDGGREYIVLKAHVGK